MWVKHGKQDTYGGPAVLTMFWETFMGVCWQPVAGNEMVSFFFF